MANWCENNLRVVGAKTTVRKFMSAAKVDRVGGEKLCFESLFPMPEDVKSVPHSFLDKGFDLWRKRTEIDEEYNRYMGLPVRFPKGVPTTTPYNWRLDNWGCTGEPQDVKLEYALLPTGKFCGEYKFVTKWSSPLYLFDRVAKSFPTLQFHLKYRDENDCFHGFTTWEKGVITEEEEVDNG